MAHLYHKVNPLLSEYIRTVLTLDNSAEKKKSQLPLFTNGTPVLICRSGNDEKVSALTLFGTSAPSDCWNVSSDETIIAYFFRPFSMSCLFGIDAVRIAKAPVDLDDWHARKAKTLIKQLECSDGYNAKIKTLDNFLLTQLKLQDRSCRIIRKATDTILAQPGKEVIGDLIHELNLNERSFQRLFKKYVGVTPTQFRQVCQFKQAFHQLKTGAFKKLTDLAYDTGFADQSHFIHSFRQHAQVTPKTYVKSGLKRR